MVNNIIHGNCIEEMKKLPENSVDAIITDPPYGIGFMGKEWDRFEPKRIKKDTEYYNKRKVIKPEVRKSRLSMISSAAAQAGSYDTSIIGARGYQKWCLEWSKEALRILKPGGFMLVSCSTRMYHRMTCGIEDAGFEIRDTIMWIYGSGFPKSLNIGKQIDKLQGNKREEYIEKRNGGGIKKKQSYEGGFEVNSGESLISKGNSEWEGWGTALKPACEPIVVARKPLSEKNVALNVLKWGTGGINIDDCRIGNEKIQTSQGDGFGTKGIYGMGINNNKGDIRQGRFPANIILDEEAGKMLDEQSGILKSGGHKVGAIVGFRNDNIFMGDRKDDQTTRLNRDILPTTGGASRFFYCAKASKSERNSGCEDTDLPEKKNCFMAKESRTGKDCVTPSKGMDRFASEPRKNHHPTVKPIALMEYLIKLVSKKGATILDPFLGSGTTMIACLKLNRKCIGIEKEEEYIKIAEARIKPFLEQQKIK